MALGIILGTVSLGVATIATVDLLHFASLAQKSADFVALAASDTSIGVVPGHPCPMARKMLEHSAFTVTECTVDGGTARVVVHGVRLGVSVSRQAIAQPLPRPEWGDSG